MSSESSSSSSAVIYDWTSYYAQAKDYSADDTLRLEAEVVRGFQRGSKELGIPTANLSMDELGEKGEGLETGIYYGRAWLLTGAYNGQCFDTVVSVGWNPFYNNTKKAVEAHLLSKVEDFYGERIRVDLYGYLRPEANFKSLDELISCINSDIDVSKKKLAAKDEEALKSAKL